MAGRTMSITMVAAVVIVGSLAAIGCNGGRTNRTATPSTQRQSQPQQTAPAAFAQEADQLPETDGEALIQYLDEQNYADNWATWPGTDGFYEGNAPHGAQLVTYVNEPAREAVEQGAAELPYDAIVVKENYSEDRELQATTVMYKVEDYNPEAGDFFWLKYDTEKQIDVQGVGQGCISCHSTAPGDNYVFTPGLAE